MIVNKENKQLESSLGCLSGTELLNYVSASYVCCDKNNLVGNFQSDAGQKLEPLPQHFEIKEISTQLNIFHKSLQTQNVSKH